MKKTLLLTLAFCATQTLHAELFTEKFLDGVIKSQIEYKKGSRSATTEGIKHGLETVFYNTGQIAFKVNNIEGERDGEMHWYDREKHHLEVIRFKLGKRHGLNQIFYENGALRIEVNYINDNKEGSEKYFFNTGTLASIINYIHGKKEGLQKEYYENGTLSNEVMYKNGYKEGKKEWYDKKGKVVKTVIFKMDRPTRLMQKVQAKKPDATLKALQGLDFNPNNRKVN